jgi:antitoxin component of MazEF toxin-antitoxin module
VKFSAKITLHGKNEAGIVRLPKNVMNQFQYKDRVKVTIVTESNKIIFYSRISKINSFGFYVPKKVMQSCSYGKHRFRIDAIDGFCLNVGAHGRAYIPNEIAHKLHLQDDDIIRLVIPKEEKKITTYNRIKARRKKRTTEYFIHLQKKIQGKSLIVTKCCKLNRNSILYNHEIDFKKVLFGLSFAEIGRSKIILFYGNRVPIVINTSVHINEISHYLGCYQADGTKRGNSWGICASTFEQARYYTKMHNHMIPNNNIDLSLSITTNQGINGEINRIAGLWYANCGTKITHKNINIRISKSGIHTNRNKFGTLVLKEHRQLTQIYYNRLLSYLLYTIKKEKNSKLAQRFVCGVMEGDGCLNARTRGHIQIATNEKDLQTITQFLKYSKLEFHEHHERNGKTYINIGGLSILENLSQLSGLLFKYYEKRRGILCRRLTNTPAAKFLVGEQKSLPPWIISKFRSNGILKDNILTSKGTKIRRAIISLNNELLG